jgi:molybdate transport system substrate-binding protein
VSRAAVALALIAALAGCGGGGARPALTVSAAASLEAAFERYGATFAAAQPRFSFGGSDLLAAQIRAGARPDVFAAANTQLPEALFRDRLLERPRIFAFNRLVIAVPIRGGRVASLADLGRRGIRLAVGSATVPVGRYTAAAIARLGAERSRRILANVRTREPDVAAIAAKVREGAVDAGFVYVTDVRADARALRAIELPARLRPRVAYAAAAVRGARHARQARDFVRGLTSAVGRSALEAAGFAVAVP